MNYTQSDHFVVDAGTGFNRHEDNAAVPTAVTEKDMNMLIWSLMEVVKAGGQAGVVFDETVPATYKVLVKALKSAFGGNVTTVNFAASPFALTVNHAGVVLIDASGGNVVVNLPAANLIAGLNYVFRRTDTSGNTVTINRAGADTIDEGLTFFTLAPRAVQRIAADGVSKWPTVSPASSASRVGAIEWFTGNVAPPGYVKINGVLLPRASYSDLYAYAVASGNMAANDGAWTSGQFSPGDGATTFRIPDWRGYHPRAWDDGRGIDAGRTIGSVQADQLLIHAHPIVDPGHLHQYNRLDDGTNASAGPYGTAVNANSKPLVNTGASATGITVSNSTGGSETRVKTIAALACIKY